MDLILFIIALAAVFVVYYRNRNKDKLYQSLSLLAILNILYVLMLMTMPDVSVTYMLFWSIGSGGLTKLFILYSFAAMVFGLLHQSANDE
ncbi:hypothetical protein DNH61_24620 [Paenibacillus sambharensis]|uniref:Uncharacterized protein n=1 Tax=Paenibacillus sambharensis TaxID=1803190 RepID=A0A2W1LDT9_9BACL|nr:hypothetical protein [Paenibacillus sambharensis]PZD93232.1 hypothetical protein DNH61_24620 [Paenibacillus sambharensis]